MKCEKNLVSHIAIIVFGIFSFVLVMSLLFSSNKKSFSDPGNIAKIIVLFVLFIGVGLLILDRVNKHIEFNRFSKQVISNLKLLTDTPYGHRDILSSNYNFINECHKQLKLTGSIFFCPEFKSYFDNLLNKMIGYNIFVKSQSGNLYVDDNAIKSRLSKEERILVVLAAQLLMENPMLSVMYSGSILCYISKLSWCSIKDESLIDRQNAAIKIVELLDNKVYGIANWKKLSSELSKSFGVIIENNKSTLEINPEYLCSENISHFKKESVLRSLLKIANLKYYSIDILEGSPVREGIEKALNIIDYCCKRSNKNDVNGIITKLSEESSDVIDIRAGFFIKREKTSKFSDLLKEAGIILKQEDNKQEHKEDSSTVIDVKSSPVLKSYTYYDYLEFKLQEICYQKDSLLEEISSGQSELRGHVMHFYKELNKHQHLFFRLLGKKKKIFNTDPGFKSLLQKCRELHIAYSNLWKQYCDLCVNQIDSNKNYCVEFKDVVYDGCVFHDRYVGQLYMRNRLLDKINAAHVKLWDAVSKFISIPEVKYSIKEEMLDMLEESISYDWVTSCNEAIEILLERQRSNIVTLKNCVLQENDIKARMRKARDNPESNVAAASL